MMTLFPRFFLRRPLPALILFAALGAPSRADDVKDQYDRIRAEFERTLDSAGGSITRQKEIIRKFAQQFYDFGAANKGDTADQALIESAAYFAMAGDTPGVDRAMEAAGKRDLSWDSKIILIEAAKDIPSRKPQARSIARGMIEEAKADPRKAAQLAPLLDELKLDGDAAELRKLAKTADQPATTRRNPATKPSADSPGARYLIPVEKRRLAPAITGKEVQSGRSLSLSQFQGKVVLIDFWATWCGPCIAELPAVKKINSAYASKGLEIIGVSADRELAALTAFIKKEKMPWPQIADMINERGANSQTYRVTGIPMTFLLDRDGRIAAAGLRGQELADAVAALLASR